MRVDKHWPVPSPAIPVTLTLPPRPGIRKRIYADVCRHCHSVHLDVTEAVKCRESSKD